MGILAENMLLALRFRDKLESCLLFLVFLRWGSLSTKGLHWVEKFRNLVLEIVSKALNNIGVSSKWARIQF